MTQKVIRDYFAAFRWGKIKETYKNYGWWSHVYFLTGTPLILGVYRDIRTVMMYYFLAVPVVFTLSVSVLQPMKLPKLMYLCPMSRKERKEYIIKSCIFRITVPIIVDILGAISLLLFGLCNPIMAAGILLSNIIFSVVFCSGINENGYGRLTEKGNRVIDIDTREHFLEMWILVVEVLMVAISYALTREDFDNTLLAKCLCIGGTVLIELPLAIAYLRHWKDAINRTMNYERQVNI